MLTGPEIYSASPSHRRECTYYIAVGYYKLRNYSHARKFNGEYPVTMDWTGQLLM
jgi:hypothetical protein